MERSNDDYPPETLLDPNKCDIVPSDLSSSKSETSSHSEKEMADVQNKGDPSMSENYPTLTLLDLNEEDIIPSHLCKIEPSLPCEKAVRDIQGKEIESTICPTDILVDIEEIDPVPSCKKMFPPLQSQTVMDEGNKYIQKKKRYESIMDMSPIRFNYECKEQDEPLANPEQVSGGAQADCPTAILIDVSISTKEDHLIPCDFSSVKNKLSPPTLHWKAPSPQSMSRISKEALKVIQDLNSSNLLDDDHLLSEEIMPIPLNFDENSDDDDDDDGLLHLKPLDNIQGEMDVISSEVSKIDLKSSDIKDTCISPKDNSLTQLCLETGDSKIEDKEDPLKCSTTSENLLLPELHSSSFENSEVFISDGDTTVFIEDNLPSQGKENMQETEDKVLTSKAVIKGGIKVPPKNSLSVKRSVKCPTLKNISNVKNVSSQNLPGIKKISSTLNYNIAPKSKELHSSEKQKLKKTTSAEPQVPKGISRTRYSHSFQYGSRSIMSFQEPKPSKPIPSMLSESRSSSADIKPSLIQMKTPAKSRYSVSTTSQKRSISKPTPTPRIPQPSIPRFTPQAISGNRMSFSKSWQQPDKSSSKGFENQGLEGRSTTSKKRFSSKLNLPSSLSAEQDKKLARALFPSKPPFK